MHDQQYFNFSGKRQQQAWPGFACKNIASRPIATLKLIWRSRKLHLALRPNKQYFSTGILLGEEKKRRFPYRESNPGRLGENQES